jgi:hypothetical protein
MKLRANYRNNKKAFLKGIKLSSLMLKCHKFNGSENARGY